MGLSMKPSNDIDADDLTSSISAPILTGRPMIGPDLPGGLIGRTQESWANRLPYLGRAATA
jgi:hypothetical protein